ncbi:MAG: SRPBCC domain-containing protein [Thermoplasmatota archaeon]
MAAKHAVRTIEQTINLNATPEQVYDALVDPKLHAEFTGAEASGAPKVGGTFTAWDGYITGKHLELVRPKKIVQEWSTSEWPEGYAPSHLEFHLEAAKGGTKLTMIQKNVPESEADAYDEGWYDNYWEPLATFFESEEE